MKLSASRGVMLSSIGLTTVLSLLSAGCSSDEPSEEPKEELPYAFCGAASTCPPDVSAVDLDTPVSFKTDVYPILTRSCSGGSGCHFSGTVTGLGFGNATNPLDDVEMEELIARLKEDARIAPGTKNVVPGDWMNSFLMMKLDGCQNKMGIACTVPNGLTPYIVCQDSELNPNNCGDGMPQSEGSASNPIPFPVADADLNTIRAWIHQGALFN